VEVFPDPKPLGKQYQYAEQKGARYALLGAKEGAVTVKNMATRESVEGVSLERAAELLLAGKGAWAPTDLQKKCEKKLQKE
jgi:histidyl-tRNA synthetase